MTFSQSFCDEYVKYFVKYTEEYGEKVCVLMQMGTFYEIQSVLVKDKYIGNLEKIANILNIHITSKKSKETEEIPKVKFAGFPKVAITKYLPILIENGYTNILIDETKIGKKITRNISGIYSSSIQPPTYNNSDNSLTSIYIETLEGINKKDLTVMYSVINMNTSINKCHVYDKISSGLKTDQIVEGVLDNIYNTILRYNSNEYLFYINDTLSLELLEKDNIITYLDLYNKNTHYALSKNKIEEYKMYQKTNYQNEYLRKVYKNVNFGLLEPVEFFDIVNCNTSIVNLIYTINFIGKHDQKYISNLATPNIITDYNNLVLEMNTIKQLNIINGNENNSRYNSLFDVVNKTSTIIGKRQLKSLLCKPLKNIKDITEKYSFSEYIESIGIKKLEYLLNEIPDFERLHRKMSLQVLGQNEFYKLHKAYDTILNLNNIVKTLNEKDIKILNEYIEEYTKIFNVNIMTQENVNFFNKGIIVEIDEIYDKIKTLENEMENERLLYEQKINPSQKGIWLKVVYLEQEGYFFTTTTIRARTLKNEPDIDIKTNTNTTKITTKNLKRISNDLLNNKEIFDKKIQLHYLIKLEELYTKYNCIFENLKEFIADIDIAKSNIKCKLLYNYCKPNILESVNENAFFEATELRHPIIERINENTCYIPNDVSLNDTENGIILYALNSCGKSSLLRSIGLCIVLAQCGLYVPCKTLNYSPFDSIITQVDLYDNLWKAQSSFITEMIGLKKIIKMADKKCLVLADEISKGTENISAAAILASSIINLSNKNCRFVFTTHLHDIPKFDEIKAIKNLGIYNLSVIVNNDVITFERKLQKGPCSELYGLEVAKAIGLDKDLINTAFELRNTLLNRKQEIHSIAKSKYNSKKIINNCEICGYIPANKKEKPLHTHHIKFQCESDNNGFNGHFYKNSKFNLVTLCEMCHNNVHLGKLNISGYIQTTNGLNLN